METIYNFSVTDEGAIFTTQVMAGSPEEAVERVRETEDEEPLHSVTVADIISTEECEGWDEFEERYKPLRNDCGREDAHDFMFETFNPDFKRVRDMNFVSPKSVWTLVETDSVSYIVTGLHFVNRIGFFLTEKEWEDESTSFVY